MFQGEVLAIHVAPRAAGAMSPVHEARAVLGRGLEGDRYGGAGGTFPDRDKENRHDPGREVTLIEVEAIEALKRDRGIEITAADTRRNILTRGVPLNHLIGVEFQVGQVTLLGVRMCEPCGHMEKLVGLEGVEAGLVHRGGLRAQVVREGTIRVGDAVRPA